MTTITTPDAMDLAKRFKASALALGQFQLDHWETLSKSQRDDLTKQEYALLDQSQNLVTAAVGVLLDETQASLADIRRATAKANQAITIVQDIQQAVKIAVALVALGVAVSTGNPAGIATAVAGVLVMADR